MPIDRLDRWLGPVIVLVALAWEGLAFAYIPGARAEGEPGPRAFPLLLGAVMAVLGVIITVSALLAHAPTGAEEQVERASRREVASVAGAFALLVGYGFLMERIGFLATTPVAVTVAMRVLLGERRWLRTLALAAGITLGCWLFFVVLLKAPLPHGTWLWRL